MSEVRLNGAVDEWDERLTSTFGEVQGTSGYGYPALRIAGRDTVLLPEQAFALARWLQLTASEELRRRRKRELELGL